MKKWPKSDPEEATSDLEIEGQDHKTMVLVALPIYTHIPNLKGLTKIFFKLLRPKGNLCGGMTVLNPKYPRLTSWDTINVWSYFHCLTNNIIHKFFYLTKSVHVHLLDI